MSATKGKRRRWPWIVAFIVSLPLLLAAVGALFLTSDAGLRWLADQVERAASTPGETTLEIVGLRGDPFQRLSADRVTLADDRDVWLGVSDVRLAWSPWALLSGRLRIRELTAGEVQVIRLPASPAEREEDAPAEPLALPLPPPLAITLERLDIAPIRIEEAVLGEAAELAVSGSMAAGGDGTVTSTLTLRRIDGTASRLDLQADYDPGTRSLALDLRAEKEPGGLTGQILSRPDFPASRVNLTGSGPLDDWRGQISAEAEGWATLESNLSLALGETIDVMLDGTVSISELDDPGLDPFVAGAHAYDVSLSIAEDLAIDLERLRVSGPAADLDAEGRIDTASEESRLSADLSLGDPAVLERAGLPLSLSGLDAHLEQSGAWAAPDVKLAITAEGLVLDGARAQRIELTATAKAADPTLPLPVDATLLASGLSVSAAPAANDLIGGRAEADLAGRFDLDATTFALERFVLKAGALRAEANGTLAAETMSELSLDVELADLSKLSALAGLPQLAGRARLSGLATYDLASERLTAQLAPALSELDTGIAGLESLVGKRIEGFVDLAYGPDEGLILAPLALDSAGATVESDRLALDPSFERLAGRVTIAVADLGRLSALAGVELGGTLAARIEAAGPLAGPVLTLDAETSKTAVAGTPVPPLAWRARMSGLDTPTAARIDGIEIAGPGLSLTGDLTGDLTAPLIEGALSLEIDERAPLQELAGGLRATRLSARIAFEKGDGQRVTARFTGSDIAYGDESEELVSLAGIEGEARVEDALAAPTIDARADGRDLRAEGLVLDDWRVSARGMANDLAFELGGRGKVTPLQEAKLSIEASGGVAQEDGGQTRISLTRLETGLNDHRVSLSEPTSLLLGAEGRMALAPTVLSVDQRPLSLSLSAEADRGAAELSLSGLDIARFSDLAGQDLPDGRLSADIAFQGAAAKTPGRFEVVIADLRLAEASDLPPVTVALNGEASGERMRIEGDVTGLPGEAPQLSADLPLITGLRPLAVYLDREAPVSAALDWQGELAPLSALFVPPNQRISGAGRVSLSLSGTPADPKVAGGVRIRDGRYEHLEYGTRLNSLALAVDATPERLEITELSGRGDDGGSLSGAGALSLDPERGFPIDARIDLSDLQMLDRDEVTARAGGAITASGSLERLEIVGRITTEEAEVRIANDLPPSVVDLDPVEIRGGEVLNPPSEDDENALLRRVLLDLLISMPQKIFVRGRGLESEWSGDITVAGTADDPQISGRLTLIRGELTAVGKLFVLEEGTIVLPAQQNAQPRIDVLARHQAEDLIVNARVTGSIDAVDIEFSSTPDLPQDEVLSRLLFGKQRAELSPAEALQLATAVADLTGATGGGGGLGIMGFARQLLGVDVLRVESTAEGAPVVAAGTYLADFLFIGVEQGADPRSGAVTAELELTDNIALESRLGGETGSSNLGILFEWEY